jgi:hypothetical protein
MADRLALYTTVYPAVERHLAAWWRSVRAQTDTNVELWIGVDGMEPEQVLRAMGDSPVATWVVGEPGDTPAHIRATAMAGMLEAGCHGVIFTDSDDTLHPSRVAVAREALRMHDVYACALGIMDERGTELGLTFGPSAGEDAAALLPRYNVFGLSNTAYRAEALRACLPVPDDCALPDWLLATRAYAIGASLHFDPVPRMMYRQYDSNVARVLTPFSELDVRRATERVLNHYRCVLQVPGAPAEPLRTELDAARARAEEFHGAIIRSADVLRTYVNALNRLHPRYVWWWCVAHPELEDVWRN